MTARYLAAAAAALVLLSTVLSAEAKPTSRPVVVDAEAEHKAGRTGYTPAPFVGTWNCNYQGRENQMIFSSFERYIERCSSRDVCEREFKDRTYLTQLLDNNRRLAFHSLAWSGIEATIRHPDGNDWQAKPLNSRGYSGSTRTPLRYRDAVKMQVTANFRGVGTRFDCTRAP